MYNLVTEEQINALHKLAKNKMNEIKSCIVEPWPWPEQQQPRPYKSSPFIHQPNPWDKYPNAGGLIINTNTTNKYITPIEMFKTEDNKATLKVALLGYSKENVSLRVSGNKLYLEAKDGGLEGSENLSKDFNIPTDYLPDSGVVKLENGVLIVSFQLKEKFETLLEIQ